MILTGLKRSSSLSHANLRKDQGTRSQEDSGIPPPPGKLVLGQSFRCRVTAGLPLGPLPLRGRGSHQKPRQGDSHWSSQVHFLRLKAASRVIRTSQNFPVTLLCPKLTTQQRQKPGFLPFQSPWCPVLFSSLVNRPPPTAPSLSPP